MSYIYEQSTGILRDEDGEIVGRGYSGYGSSKNKAADEHIRNKGPIPRGKYDIGSSYNSDKCGKLSIRLTPNGHSAHGRTDFLIHGDNSNGTASKGCIVMEKHVRTKIDNGDIKSLKVVETYTAPSSQTSSYTYKSSNYSSNNYSSTYSSNNYSYSTSSYRSSQLINDEGIGNDRVRVGGGFANGNPEIAITVGIPCLIL